MAAPLATLQANAFKPGYDPRRLLPENTGKRYVTVKRILRNLAELPGGKINGKEVSRLEMALHKALRDACSDKLTPQDRRQALTLVIDRLEGKAVERVRSSMRVSVGTAEEQRLKIEAECKRLDEIGRQRLLAKGVKIEEAEFTEEQTEQNNRHSETTD